MDIGSIDFWAVHGRSVLHRASASTKLAAAAILIVAIVATGDPFTLIAIYLAVVDGIVLSGLPVLRLLALAAYPVLFVLLFAASRWTGSLLDPLVILLKAMAAAATMVALVATTPYPQLFALLRRVLPWPVADALFLTYRSLFILLDVLGDLLVALRLRGGVGRRSYLRNARNLAAGLGLLLVRGIAYSEQLYHVLRLRGYSGRLAAGPFLRPATGADLLPLGAALAILGAVLFFRFVPDGAQYNGFLLLASLLALPLAWRARRPPGMEAR